MAYQFDVNNNNGANGGAEVMFALRQLLVSVGWVVLADSDGTTYSGTGVQITHASSGANGMNNSRAWFRIQDPAGVREFCIQRGTAGNTAWWIKYSALDRFTTGGDATNMPTATDQQNVGGGSSVVGATIFATANTYQYHLGADDAAPYTFYAFAAVDTTAVTAGAFFMDAMVAGSYPAEDTDPVVITATNSTLTYSSWTSASASSAPSGWFRMNMTREAWVIMLGHRYYNSGYGIMAPSEGTHANPYTTGEDTLPIPYGRAASAGSCLGWKGVGSMVRWTVQDRANMDTISAGGVRFRVLMDDVTFPWPDVVPVLA